LLKGIVVLLALANVGYFLWTRNIAHPPETVPEAPIATLKLTSEVPRSQRGVPQPTLAEDPGSPSVASGIPGAGGAGPGVTGPGGAGPGVTGSGVTGPGVTGPGVTRPGVTGSGVTGPGVTRPGVATPLVGIPVLTTPVLATPGVAAPGAGSAALLMSVKRCVSVGPFRDASQTARASSTLRGGGYDPRQRVAEGDVYWIDIDLQPTDSVPQPSDLQSETGRIQRLEVKACPNAGATP
jgi:hypothetical protein